MTPYDSQMKVMLTPLYHLLSCRKPLSSNRKGQCVINPSPLSTSLALEEGRLVPFTRCCYTLRRGTGWVYNEKQITG